MRRDVDEDEAGHAPEDDGREEAAVGEEIGGRVLAPAPRLEEPPAKEAEDDERSRYRWGYHWGAELDAVLSPRVRQAIERHGYRLGSYRDLAATRL